MRSHLSFAPVVALVSSLTVSAGADARQVSPYAAPPDLTDPPADAVKSASGLISKVITPGTGTEHPEPTDVVVVQYTGWSAETRGLVDTSLSKDKPPMFPLNQTALAGWSECVQLMVVGEKRRCWMPEKLAYNGAPKRPTGMLVFDIELLDTYRSPTNPPPDVKAPPADATRTASGLATKVLRPGTGTRTPRRSDRVKVHYSGWQTNGRPFDSSLARGEPVTFGLDDVIRGWSEGLQLMGEGERRRLWIPQDLAYKGEGGAPRGMLVFDVQLIEIE